MPASSSGVHPATVRKQIASGKTAPLYLILGEDDEERSRLASEFANVVEEDLRPFNVERLYGGEATAGALIEAARTLPMLALPILVPILLSAVETFRALLDGATLASTMGWMQIGTAFCGIFFVACLYLFEYVVEE